MNFKIVKNSQILQKMTDFITQLERGIQFNENIITQLIRLTTHHPASIEEDG